MQDVTFECHKSLEKTDQKETRAGEIVTCRATAEWQVSLKLTVKSLENNEEHGLQLKALENSLKCNGNGYIL